MATPSRGKGRPKLAETAGIDNAIREAALEVLLDQGELATMNAIALAAGVSRKSLYARYANKELLFVDAIGDLLKSAGGLEFDTAGTAADALFNYIKAAFDVIARPRSKAINQLLTRNPKYVAALRSDMQAAMQTLFFEPLQTLLDEARQAGLLVVDEVDATAHVLIRLIIAESVASYNQARIPTVAERDAYSQYLVKLVTQGLLPRTT